MAAMPTDTFGFVFRHTDSCPGCAFGEFCPEGKKLIKLASAICKVFAEPVPPIPRSPYKA